MNMMNKLMLVLGVVFMLSFMAFDAQAQGKSKKEKAKKETKAKKEVKEVEEVEEVKSEKANKGKAVAKGNQEISIATSVQCDMCKEKIEKALSLTKGIKAADVDVEAQTVKVTFNSTQVSADDIKQVISKTGYDADDVKAEKASYDKLPRCCKKSE